MTRYFFIEHNSELPRENLLADNVFLSRQDAYQHIDKNANMNLPQLVEIEVPDDFQLEKGKLISNFVIINREPLDTTPTAKQEPVEKKVSKKPFLKDVKKILETKKQNQLHQQTMFNPSLTLKMEASLLSYMPNEVTNGKFRNYLILTHEIINFNQKIASIGSSILDREIITLDPDSPILATLYADLKKRILTDKDPLQTMMDFIRENVIDSNEQDLKNKILQVIKNWSPTTEDAFATTHEGEKIPVIPIDYFIENKACVCRHHALLNAFFMHKLMEEGYLPKGEVHHHRDVVPNGNHAWVVYKHDENLILIDTLWKDKPLNINLANQQALKSYGNAIDNMKKEYLITNTKNDGKQPKP